MPSELKLTLETVTPLFLGGADPRGAPELRPPSFRGAMRYWLRALVGAAGEQMMRQSEARLFGVGGDQASAGAVSLRLTQSPKPQQQSYTALSQGIGYLWFAARATKREQERYAIMPATLTLTLSAPRSMRPEVDLAQAGAILWLFTRLGGIGARSRRFAGGIQVAAVQLPHNTNSLLASLPISANSPEELVQELSNGICKARQAFGMPQLTTPAPDAFDVLHPDQCQIFVVNKTFSSWSDAIDKMGQAYQAFRRLRQPDYQVVKQAMNSQQNLSGTVERAAFGLPLPFFYRSLNKRTGTLQAKLEDQKLDRRASPLWMRVVKLHNGQYTVVFTWFKSQFLPADARLVLTERSKVLYGDRFPSNRLIAQFLNGSGNQQNPSLKDAGYNLLEVPLT